MIEVLYIDDNYDDLITILKSKYSKFVEELADDGYPPKTKCLYYILIMYNDELVYCCEWNKSNCKSCSLNKECKKVVNRFERRRKLKRVKE